MVLDLAFIIGESVSGKGETADSRDSKSLGIRLESREYDGHPGNTMGIPGIQYKHAGNPTNTM